MLGDQKVTAPALDDFEDEVDITIELDELEPLPKALVGAYLIG